MFTDGANSEQEVPQSHLLWEDPSGDLSPVDVLLDLLRQIPKGAIGATGSVVAGGGRMAESNPIFGPALTAINPVEEAGRSVQDFGERLLPGGPRTFAGEVGQGLGSALPLLAASAVNPALAIGAGAAMGADDLGSQAEAAGASEEQQILATLAGSVIGLTEGIPMNRLLGRLGRLSGGQERSVLGTGLVQAIEEAYQEGFNQMATDASAAAIFDPDRELSPGAVLRSAALGGIVGGTLGLSGGVAARGINRASSSKDPSLDSGAPLSVEEQVLEVAREVAPTLTSLIEETENAVTAEETQQGAATGDSEIAVGGEPFSDAGSAFEDGAGATEGTRLQDVGEGSEGSATLEGVPLPMAPPEIAPRVSDHLEDFRSEDEYLQAVADESQSLEEVASALRTVESREDTTDPQTLAFESLLGRSAGDQNLRISRESFVARFGEPAAEGSVARNYLSTAEDALTLEQVAEKVAEDTDRLPGEEEILAFIRENPHPGSGRKGRGRLANELRSRLRELTPSSPAQPVTDLVGLDKERASAVRSALGLESLPDPLKRAWASAAQEAEATGLVEEAESRASAILAGRAAMLTDAEHIAMLVREADLEAQEAEVLGRFDEALAAGDEAAMRDLRIEHEGLRERVDTITRAVAQSGTELGRAFRARAASAARRRYAPGQVRLRAKASKGADLTKKEGAGLDRLSKRLRTEQDRLRDLETSDDRARERLEEEEAQQTLQGMRRRRTKREQARTERQSVLQELRALGFQVHDALGLTAQSARLITRLARTYVSEGVTRLPELSEALRSRVEGLRHEDVLDVLGGRYSPKRQRSELAAQMQELRSQAKLLREIDQFMEFGTLPNGQPRTPSSAEVQRLREKLAALRADVMQGERDRARLERMLGKIDEVEEALRRGDAKVTKTRRADPEAIAAAKERLRDLRAEHAAETRLGEIEQAMADLAAGGDPAQYVRQPRESRRQRDVPKALRDARARVRARQGDLDRAVASLRPLGKREAAESVLELPRNILASGDVGALGRQGIFHVMNPLNVRKTARATRSMLRVFGAELAGRSEVTEAIQEGIRENQHYAMALADGLALKELEGLKFADRETVVVNNLIQRLEAQQNLKKGQANRLVRGIGNYMRSSERNMVVGLNVLRMEVYADAMTKLAAKGLDLRSAEGKAVREALAHYINVTTGHGAGRSIGPAGEFLARFFFSPRLAWSRLQTPFTLAITAAKHPELRGMVARDLGGMAVTSGALLALAGLMGASLERDAEDSDFLKVQFGNTRLDFLGGYGQAIRLYMRSVGRIREGRIFQETLGLRDPEAEQRGDILGLFGQFLRYKMAPSVAGPLQFAQEIDALGRGTGRGEIALRSLAPIVLQESVDSFRDGGTLAALGAFGLGMIGVGVSTFDDPLRHADIEPLLAPYYTPRAGDLSTDPGAQASEVSDAAQEAYEQAFKQALADELRARPPESREDLQGRAKAIRSRLRQQLRAGVPAVPPASSSGAQGGASKLLWE